MQYDITSIDGLIRTVGGDSPGADRRVAEWLGISTAAVLMWRSRGEIPTGWHLRLYAKVRACGRTIDPQVFGLSSEEFGPLVAVSRETAEAAE